MSIYKRGQGVKLGTTVKQHQLVVREGLEPGTSRLQVQRPNHSTTLPPQRHNVTCYVSLGQKQCRTVDSVNLPCVAFSRILP